MFSSDNQPPPYGDVDLFGSDTALAGAVRANGAAAEEKALAAFGRRWGAAAMFDQAQRANDAPPRLVGEPDERRDCVLFDPAYHAFMQASLAEGLHAMTWQADGT